MIGVARKRRRCHHGKFVMKRRAGPEEGVDLLRDS